jgi:hypothetical protein
MTYARSTENAAALADSEEFAPLSTPAAGEQIRDGPAGNGHPPNVPHERDRALAVGEELLAEHVYPVSDGRLISHGPLARAWHRLQHGLDSAPERAEREVDMRLRALARRVMRRPALIASLSPKGGTGKTTLAVLLAQLVSTRLRWPVLVLDTDFTGGTAREHIPSDGQTSATLVDALKAIRAGKIRGPADLLRYVCVIPGGARRHERERGTNGGIGTDSFGPRARETEWSHVLADGRLHATGHLLEWPRSDVRATFLQGVLMGAPATRAVALVMNVLGPRKATRRAERAAEEASAEGWLRQRIGRRTTARDRARKQAVAQREHELAAGHALVQFAGYVTVSAPVAHGVGELNAAFGRVQAAALAAGLRLERMPGEQQEALTYTLPLCRGLA